MKDLRDLLGPGRRMPAALFLLVSVLALTAAGCGGGGAKYLNLTLSPNNPNTCGETDPHTLEVRIYQLNDVRLFQGATMDELWADNPEVLTDEIVGSAVLTRVYPGKTEDFRPVELDGATRYIGVVGNFCAREGDCWKATLAVNPSSDAKFTLDVRETCLSLTVSD